MPNINNRQNKATMVYTNNHNRPIGKCLGLCAQFPEKSSAPLKTVNNVTEQINDDDKGKR